MRWMTASTGSIPNKSHGPEQSRVASHLCTNWTKQVTDQQRSLVSYAPWSKFHGQKVVGAAGRTPALGSGARHHGIIHMSTNTSLDRTREDKVPSSCTGVRAAQLNRWRQSLLSRRTSDTGDRS
jgi:hypothetical protein